MDADAGVHVRIGDWVLANGRVPVVDLFGFSKPQGEWFAYEWLAGVLFSLANSAAGLKGLVLLSGAVLAAVPLTIAMHAAWRGASGLIVILATLVAANSLNIHFLARPHIFTLLFLAIAFWLIERDRRMLHHGAAGADARVWLLVPLMALWSNLHGGFFIVAPLLVLLIAGCLAERRAGAGRYSLLLGLSMAATIANPYGLDLHSHIIKYLQSQWVIRFVDEFKSPSFRSETMLCFMMLLFAALMAAGTLLRRGRYTEVLWIGFFSYCALTSVRHTTVFMVIVVPLVAEEWSHWWPQVRDFAPVDLRRLTPWPAAFVLLLAVVPSGTWPTEFPRDLLPIAMVERHAERLETARAFTTDQWADYLIYRNYRPLEGRTHQRVFMDARHNYFGEKIGNEFIQLTHALPGWRDIVDKYAFDAMLLPPDIGLTALLAERPEWKVLDRDAKAVLFVRQERRQASRSPSGSPLEDESQWPCDSCPRIELASAR